MVEADPSMASEHEARAGARLLALFGSPLNEAILRTLAGQPMRLAELQAALGSAPQTTLRGHVKGLADIGALDKQRRDGSVSAVDYELTPLGLELLEVADALERWLALAPGGPIALDSDRGKVAVKSLGGGWESTILRALGARPLSLAELNGLIDAYSYPALERRLSRMRATGQVETTHRGARTLYTVTDWMRRAIAPLTMAGRCERRHIAELTAPITYVEVEAAFLLALPLVVMSEEIGGDCVLAADTGPDNEGPRVSGIHVVVERGRVLSLSEDLEDDPTSWCVGSANAWMDAVIDGDAAGLRIGGSNHRLPRSLVGRLHVTLFRE
jgi:DNA-binding HxlR family transcriptional regulator